METVIQREVAQKVFETRERALNVMSALVGDNFNIRKTKDNFWVCQYEKETSIIMDGEMDVVDDNLKELE